MNFFSATIMDDTGPPLRTCICNNRGACRKLTEQLWKYAKHRGTYVKLPRTSANTPRGVKCRAWVKHSLRRLGVTASSFESYSTNTRHYISHLHFPSQTTVGKDTQSVDFMLKQTITVAQVREWGIATASNDKSPIESDH